MNQDLTYGSSKLVRFLAIFLSAALSFKLLAHLHSIPITLIAKNLGVVQYHPVNNYRVFASDDAGNAVPIPFQIDEKDRYGDYILDKGELPNSNLSNQVFDNLDELTLMGNDVGILKVPTKWSFPAPDILYQVLLKHQDKIGAIYVGVYFNSPPTLTQKTYVQFDLANALITTSKYTYKFNHKNYLVVRSIDIKHNNDKITPIINSSTFYLRADLKYFLTLAINENDIQSALEAYKSGPIRTITRVTFNYPFLNFKFDLGMYTEVSFFSNSVILPAVIDNPLEGAASLNSGSIFYYGLSLISNPKLFNINTNIPAYSEKSLLDFLSKKETPKSQYWIEAQGQEETIYLEFSPSEDMKKNNCVPMLYIENLEAEKLKNRSQKAEPLGRSPVNVAIAIDLVNLRKGLHDVAFRLFIDSKANSKLLEEIKIQNEWRIVAFKLAPSAYKLESSNVREK